MIALDCFIHQVQVVGYLHERYNESADGGAFLWWGADGVHRTSPKPRSGTAVDGSKTIHAAAAYRPGEGPPPIDKNADVTLAHVAGRRWELRGDRHDPKRVLRSYDEAELRISIVYRAHCFADAAEAALFHRTQPMLRGSSAAAATADAAATAADDASAAASSGGPAPGKGPLTLDAVLSTLRDDVIRRRGALAWPEGIAPYAVAMKLLREYVRYPPPPGAWLPLNHCALGGLLPRLKPLLSRVCKH